MPFHGIDLDQVPCEPGVYVVLREKDSRPAFLDENPAGWFKGQNPTVPGAELEVAWPEGAHCVYIGKAAAGRRGRRPFDSGSRSCVGTATASRSATKAAGALGSSSDSEHVCAAGTGRRELGNRSRRDRTR